MNNKVITSAALLAAVSSPAWAFDGAYGGVQLGYNSTSIDYNETDNATYNIGIDGLSAKGADYGVYGGYGKVVGNNVYLGGEAEFNLSDAKNTLESNLLAGDVETKKKSSYGAAVRAGYVVGNVMPYARLGYNRAKFEQEVTGIGSGDETKGGVSYGVGMELKATDHVALRGEFVRTSYGKITGTDGTTDWKYKPVENVARVGISYRF